MTPLNHYMQDGANRQARAVLCLLQGFYIEDSHGWTYNAQPQIARWENCREQGYVVMLRGENNKCLNIAFFEHRNDDSICAIKWEQPNFPNSPTIATADFKGTVYKDKWDVSKQVGFGAISEMADWITAELKSFWLLNFKPTPTIAS